MNNDSSAWPTHPDYKIEIELIDKWLSIVIDDVIIAESEKVLLLREQDHEPIYYFPRHDILMACLYQNKHETFCPFKGIAKHWTINLKDIKINLAAWSYEEPFKQVIEIKNKIGFYPEVLKHVSFN